jgi:hypothetical protein
MGQSKGGGYDKLPTFTPEQSSALSEFLRQAQQNSQAAGEAYKSFLPGGTGAESITKAAQQRYNQQTLPSILNAYGTGNKGSSGLNQALASSASDLNTNIASQLAGMQLQAAGGLGGLGLGQGQIGSQSQFAYAPQQQSFLQSLLLSLLGSGGQVARGAIGGGF